MLCGHWLIADLYLPGGVLLDLDPEEGSELVEHALSAGAAALHELEEDEDEDEVPAEAVFRLQGCQVRGSQGVDWKYFANFNIAMINSCF